MAHHQQPPPSAAAPLPTISSTAPISPHRSAKRKAAASIAAMSPVPDEDKDKDFGDPSDSSSDEDGDAPLADSAAASPPRKKRKKVPSRPHKDVAVCSQCYAPVIGEKGTMSAEDKKKHDEIVKSWKTCVVCDTWIHKSYSKCPRCSFQFVDRRRFEEVAADSEEVLKAMDVEMKNVVVFAKNLLATMKEQRSYWEEVMKEFTVRVNAKAAKKNKGDTEKIHISKLKLKKVGARLDKTKNLIELNEKNLDTAFISAQIAVMNAKRDVELAKLRGRKEEELKRVIKKAQKQYEAKKVELKELEDEKECEE